MPYDYRSSTITQDREAAQKVEARADERLAQSHKPDNGTAQHNGDTEEADKAANGEDAAARTLQSEYRSVSPS